SKGMDIGNVGELIFDFVNLDFGMGIKKSGSLEGRIIFIDSFGNIVTNIPSGMVDFQPGNVLEIEKKQVLFQSSYGFCKLGEPLALIGSHGYLEIAVNQGRAAEFFNKKQGDGIAIKT
ncbi:MAG: SAM-dependent chlorinase/fluorinase, partial [Euryarchaeota archaeon]|nr:SAM-dependent chlorinase/fluorinase [Euryarchaeota archaeon]